MKYVAVSGNRQTGKNDYPNLCACTSRINNILIIQNSMLHYKAFKDNCISLTLKFFGFSFNPRQRQTHKHRDTQIHKYTDTDTHTHRYTHTQIHNSEHILYMYIRHTVHSKDHPSLSTMLFLTFCVSQLGSQLWLMNLE